MLLPVFQNIFTYLQTILENCLWSCLIFCFVLPDLFSVIKKWRRPTWPPGCLVKGPDWWAGSKIFGAKRRRDNWRPCPDDSGWDFWSWSGDNIHHTTVDSGLPVASPWGRNIMSGQRNVKEKALWGLSVYQPNKKNIKTFEQKTGGI